MKRTLLSMVATIVAALWLCGCGVVAGGVGVKVSNPLPYDRTNESIEIEWKELEGHNLTPDRVVVMNEEREQLPSQVIFDDNGQVKSLLFQASVEASGESRYKIRRRRAEDYPQQAYGRYVPERMDDYAWENNLTAYRIYGPRLKDPQTQGVDVWVKSTEKLIINEWYARNDYHHNYGEGMDCYKVGNTLGGGALAVVEDSRLVLSGNYLSQRCVANGPLRTEAEFVYAPVEVGERDVVIKRRIWLDANSRFTFQEYVLSGFEGEVEVAAGVVMHDVKHIQQEQNWIAMTEAVSDSRDPERDGDISLGVILVGGEKAAIIDSHAVTLRRVKAGESILMLNASGWSQAAVDGGDEWVAIVKRQTEILQNPLQIELQ